MFMRFVQLNIETERLDDFERLYRERIAPALNGTPGCLFAGLMNRHGLTEECVSMTLWDTAEDARRYEESGLFEELLAEADPMISDSSEWRIRLSDDLRLEYGPVKEAPVVTVSSVRSASSESLPEDIRPDETYLRIVSARVQPGQFDALAKVYEEKIIPALASVDGCRYAYLVRGMQESDQALSITLWDSQSHAEAYEQSGRFADLVRLVRPMFSELLQWKMSLSPKKQDSTATSEDLTVEGYHVVTTDSFSGLNTD
jgi:heme-degrading monooxygenase HmoA